MQDDNPLAHQADDGGRKADLPIEDVDDPGDKAGTSTRVWVDLPRWFDWPALRHLDHTIVVVLVTVGIAMPDTIKHGPMAAKVFLMDKMGEKSHVLHACMAVLFGWLMPTTFTALRAAIRPETGHLAVLAPPGSRLPSGSLVALRRWRIICLGLGLFFLGPGVFWLFSIREFVSCVWLICVTPVIMTWLFALHVAAATTNARIHSARDAVRSASNLTAQRWVDNVHKPIVEVATVALPALSAWGTSLGSVVIGLGGYGLANINIGVTQLCVQQLSIGCAMFTVPLVVLLVPTGVSSECDKLNADLNDLRTDPNLPADISTRLDNLEMYLMRLNRQQGPGFVMWDTVLNRTALHRVAAKLWGLIATLFVFLYDGSVPTARGGKMLGCQNGGWMLGSPHNNSRLARTDVLSMHNETLQAASYAVKESVEVDWLVDSVTNLVDPTEAECISLVRKHYPDANAAEFSNIGGGWCNAVFGAVGVIFDPSVQTCMFEDPAQDCACP